MRPVILKTGSTLPDLLPRRGDFEDWFATGLGWPLRRFAVIDAQRAAELPDPTGVDGVVVTGSPATVHEHAPWSDRAGAWLRAAVQAGVPVLGICYGHQLLADAFGGLTGLNPTGREIGHTEVHVVADDPLFEDLPPVFPVVTTHRDAVLEVPAGARILARNGDCEVQALAFGPKARTLQWHPEMDADIIRHYLHVRRELIDAERGAGAAADLLARVRDVASGRILLQNFRRHFLGVA